LINELPVASDQLPVGLLGSNNWQLTTGNYSGDPMPSARRIGRQRGFTLIELLVVIGIMLLLMAILLPVVGQVQVRAQGASTQSQMARIMAACQEYYHDFNAYPGPIANVYLSGGAGTPDPLFSPPVGAASDGSAANGPSVTSSENLVLGLFGFLSPPTTAQPKVMWTDTTYNAPFPPVNPPAHDVLSLNPLRPVAFHYMDYVADELSTGPASGLEYTASMGTNTDTMGPEFVDRYSKHLPILYMRANAGNPGTASAGVTYYTGSVDVGYQYNCKELKDYISFVRYSDGTPPQVCAFTAAAFPGDAAPAVDVFQVLTTAYNDVATSTSPILADSEATPVLKAGTTSQATFSDYLANPNVANSVRGKDTFILISAGADHTYGTTDDYIITP
jgi:prepilin-type N-terminal cleavage/methylation domain-containing protein